MFKKISLLALMLAVLGMGTYALSYIPPGVDNCQECKDYWMNNGYSCQSAYQRCFRYFDCDPC